LAGCLELTERRDLMIAVPIFKTER